MRKSARQMLWLGGAALAALLLWLGTRGPGPIPIASAPDSAGGVTATATVEGQSAVRSVPAGEIGTAAAPPTGTAAGPDAPATETAGPAEPATETLGPVASATDAAGPAEPSTEAPGPVASATDAAAVSTTADQPAQDAGERAPVFDVVRVAPDGQTVIAGQAGPGQTVEILLDGAVIGTEIADASGAFSTVLAIPPSTESRELVLRVPGAGVEAGAVALAPGAAAETGAAYSQAAEAAAATAAAEAEAAQAAADRAAAVAVAASESERAAAEAAAATAAAEAAEASAAAKQAAVLAAKAEADRQAAEAAAATVVASADPGSRDLSSAPVLILPQPDAEQAPVLVSPGADDVTLLQPAAGDAGAGLLLDRITYSEGGDMVASGRGRPGSAIRIYANGILRGETRSDTQGQWTVRLAADDLRNAALLRFDEIDAQGKVLSRLETPFEYTPLGPAHELKERKIVVQKGDYLWKFAEQYYGKGWRYSVIFGANSDLIRDPDLIYPGQVFTIPELVDSQ